MRLGAANGLQVLGSGLLPLLLLLAIPGLEVPGLLALMAAGLGALSIAWIAAPLGRAARVGAARCGAGRGCSTTGRAVCPARSRRSGCSRRPVLAATSPRSPRSRISRPRCGSC